MIRSGRQARKSILVMKSTDERSNLKTLTILFKTYQAVLKKVKESLKSSELTINEFTALEALNTLGSLTTSDLTNRVLLPNSSMTYVLDRLHSKGLINRTKDPIDSRVQRVALTVTGKDTITNLYQQHESFMRPYFEVLEEEEEQQLQYLLKKVGYKAADKDATDEAQKEVTKKLSKNMI